MPERTEIEKYVRFLIALDILSRPLESLGKKGIRRLDKTAKSIVELLKAGEEKGDRVYVEIKEIEEEEKARTMNEGIEAFCKKHPEYGKELKNLIDEKRKERNNYLIYRLREDYKLGEDDYIQVMIDLGFDKRQAAAMYSHIVTYSEREGKANENEERKILLKEQKPKKKQKGK